MAPGDDTQGLRTFGANPLRKGGFSLPPKPARNGFCNCLFPGCNRNREKRHAQPYPHRGPHQGAHAPQEGIAIGSGVVEAACKTLVTQRLKRSGMRWKIVSGQAVLSFHPLIKSGRFDRTWATLIGVAPTPVNDNINAAAAMAIAA